MAKQITVGEAIDLEQPANYVRLPDGTVVTARRYYMVQHEGEHVAGGTKFYGVPADQEPGPEPKPADSKPPAASKSTTSKK